MRLKTNEEIDQKNLALLMETQVELSKYNVKFNIKEVQSLSRKQNAVYSRACIAYYLRHKGYSTLRIGQIINRDHASIIHLLKYGDRKYHSSWNHEKYNEFKNRVNNIASENLVQYHTEKIKFHVKELNKLTGNKFNYISDINN